MNIQQLLFYFLGVDPASSVSKRAADGALAVLRASPRVAGELSGNPADWYLDWVWAKILKSSDVDVWSGTIHTKHQEFGFTRIMMDAGAGGGGLQIMAQLGKHDQLIRGIKTKVRPICSLDDPTSPDAEFILDMFRRGDGRVKALWPLALQNESNLPENMHVVGNQAVEHHMWSFPVPFNERPREETDKWTDEKQWALKLLDAGRKQLENIEVECDNEGKPIYNGFNARTFKASGRKDIAYAMLMAHVSFLIWLRLNAMGWEVEGSGETCATF